MRVMDGGDGGMIHWIGPHGRISTKPIGGEIELCVGPSWYEKWSTMKLPPDSAAALGRDLIRLAEEATGE